MIDDVATLVRINAEIGAAESRADAAYFADLLCPQFVMGRPDGTLDDKATFVAGMREGAERTTEAVEVTVLPANRAVVTCLVTKHPVGEPAAARRFHNLRVFVRQTPVGPWRLMTWLNEPAPLHGRNRT